MPLVQSNHIVSVISGNYIDLSDDPQVDQAIGAIGHLATRSHYRRGQGHGSALVKEYEREIEEIALTRGQELAVVVLEAEADSVGFWAKCGYQWPVNSWYAQPPLVFDPVTGERCSDEVPEILMLKVLGEPSASQIDRTLLVDAIHRLYQRWYMPDKAAFSASAMKRAEDYVFGKIFKRFLASLPAAGKPVPLGAPPF